MDIIDEMTENYIAELKCEIKRLKERLKQLEDQLKVELEESKKRGNCHA